MSFEQPWAWAALVLALPWWWWLRRGAPRRWTVGGLDPFRAATAAEQAHRRRPPWSWTAFVAALACACAALAGVRTGVSAPVLLQDESLSVTAAPVAAPAWTGARRRIGGRGDPVAEEEIFAALRALGGRRAEVWTDRPAPRGLPAPLRWRDEAFRAFRGANAAILNAVPVAPDRWAVHWINAGVEAPLYLDGGEARTGPLAGEEGVAEVAVPADAESLVVVRAGGGAPDARDDHAWTLPGAVRFVIAPRMDPRWPQALGAAWPGARVQVGDEDSAQAASLHAAGGPGLALEIPADVFARLPENEAVARIAAAVQDARRALWPPRARAECASSWEPRRFPAGLAAATRPGTDRRRAAAALGLGFLLVGLLLLKIGR